MIGLFDRDIFLRLCCCDLWQEALDALGITEPYRLAATSSKRSNSKVITRFLGGADPALAIVRTNDIVAVVPVLSDEMVLGIEATKSYQDFDSIDDIDGGEQLLTAILANHPDGKMMLSGDKRFVSAFRTSLPKHWAALSESVVSFEKCLIAIEGSFGFDLIVERAADVRQCDGSLRLALSGPATSGSFCEAMNSFDPCKDQD